MSWRRGQTAILTQSSSSTIAALLSHLGWVAQPWVTESPKPSVCKLFSRWHLVSNRLKPSVLILFFNVYLFPLFLRLFTQVHLLIDGLVEGQYIRKIAFAFNNSRRLLDEVSGPGGRRGHVERSCSNSKRISWSVHGLFTRLSYRFQIHRISLVGFGLMAYQTL